jgi:hypothetical protein
VHLAQADTSKQPAYSAADAALNGQPSVTGDNSNDALVAAGSKSVATIKALHSGSGVTLACGLIVANNADANNPVLATSGLNVALAGINIDVYYGSLRVWVTGQHADYIFAVNLGARSGKGLLIVSHATTRSPQYQVRWIAGGAEVAEGHGSYGYAASADDSFSDLAILDYSFATTSSSGHAYGGVRIWPDADISHAAIQAAHEAEFGT